MDQHVSMAIDKRFQANRCSLDHPASHKTRRLPGRLKRNALLPLVVLNARFLAIHNPIVVVLSVIGMMCRIRRPKFVLKQMNGYSGLAELLTGLAKRYIYGTANGYVLVY
ncbi:MAG: hypothetical protein O9353_05000 [Bacteroidia bacterium]|nr:hypothetical protein [Bacteroidia bacterium]